MQPSNFHSERELAPNGRNVHRFVLIVMHLKRLDISHTPFLHMLRLLQLLVNEDEQGSPVGYSLPHHRIRLLFRFFNTPLFLESPAARVSTGDPC